jgi:pimeloyl-ACP methyl ester carboxylesterase
MTMQGAGRGGARRSIQQRHRDGVALSFEEAGTGDGPVLLVHGGLCDHTNLDPQLAHFGRRRRTVAVDLRGHGRSDKPRQEYTIPGFGDDLAWLCHELGLARPVVIGHSMGGLIALEVAARFEGLPAAVVILDAPVVPPQAFVEAVQPFAQAVQTPHYREAVRQFMGQFIGFADDPEHRECLLEAMASTPQHVVASTLRNYVAYDSAAAAGACKVPVLYVSSGPWFADVTRLRALCPQLVTGQTVGSGHYHQLEVPEQVNAMIDRFLSITLGRPD